MTEENCENKLTIKTTENSKTTTERFENPAAKDKMNEMEKENSGSHKKN
jgi:hypothetical protein